MTPTRLRLWTTIAIVFILFWLLSSGVNMYTDYLWFQSLAFESVFLTSLLGRVVIFFLAAIPFAVIFLGNVILARWLSTRETLFIGQQRTLDLPVFGWLIWIMGLFLGWAVGMAAAPRWLDFLRFFNQVPFDVSDPLFGNDVAFYIFSLPLYQFIQGWLITTLMITLIGVVVIYFFAQLNNLREGTVIVLPHARLHMSALGAALFAVIAWGHRLAAFNLLYSPRGAAYGASYTDVHVELIALKAMFWLALAIAALLLANVVLKKLWFPIIAAGAWMGIAILIIGIVPGIVQRYMVEPNELARETPYIEHNIQFTRQAYGLDDVQEMDFGQVEPLTGGIIDTNRTTLKNVRLWDYRPLASTYRQIQEIRLYYAFNDLDIDRYWVNGEYRQVILAGRELNQSQLQSPTWVNQHLQFTHGYGVVMNPVNEVTPDGLPELWIKDLPPVSSVPIEVTRPEIYFGEFTSNYVFVNTGIEEFDYPRGEDNVYATYEGEGGVPLNSYIKRLAFSLRLADINMLLSDYLTSGSRLMLNRLIGDRVELVAPFLEYDQDPYLVISDGKLYWVQDAYTVSDHYPYAEPMANGINYLRNSVKVVIDAYDGSMVFYIADPTDPIVQTYAGIFPDLFTPMDEMSEELRLHMRYPEDMFAIQTMMYQTYHMEDVNVFYNKEDLWNLPREVYGAQGQRVEPYYVIIKLPNAEEEEFMLIQPFTPATKDNLIAWMAGLSDGDNYGQLVVYRFSKSELIFGPSQIEARIDQDPEISSQLSLWSQRGSEVIRGDLLVIPLDQSLLYVEPLYLQSETGQIPELQRIILAEGERVVMSESLSEGLVRLFGEGAGQAVRTIEAEAEESGVPAETYPQGTSPRVYELASQAEDRYAAAQAALQEGDWATYGEELEEMERLLNELVTLTAPTAE
jgi:uncharacterized protein